MAYTPRTWLDRAVQFATRYKKSNETSTSVTLDADPGIVTQAGTPVNAANMNAIEQGIAAAHATADGALQRAGGMMTGAIYAAPTTGAIGVASGNSKLEVKNNGGAGDAAYMSFHRQGIYAAHFGIDTDNEWKVGGWSEGATTYKLWTEKRLRTTNGYPEININGVWFPMGGATVGIGNTVQHDFPTQYVGSAAGFYTLVAKFVPKGTGEITIEAEISGGTGAATGVAAHILAARYPNQTYPGEFIYGPSNVTFNWSTPLGTNISSSPGAGAIMQLGAVVSGSPVVKRTGNFLVYQKQPVYICLRYDGGSQPPYIQNIKVKYDIVG